MPGTPRYQITGQAIQRRGRRFSANAKQCPLESILSRVLWNVFVFGCYFCPFQAWVFILRLTSLDGTHPSIHPSIQQQKRKSNSKYLCWEFLMKWNNSTSFSQAEREFICVLSELTSLVCSWRNLVFPLPVCSFSISPAISTSMMCEHEPRKLVFPCAAGHINRQISEQTNIKAWISSTVL